MITTTEAICLKCKRIFTHRKCEHKKFCSRQCFWTSGIRCGETRKKTPILERFLNLVHKTENCWFWIAATRADGYGAFQLSKKVTVPAHRMSWTLHRGPIPKDKLICHTCDIRQCVNPDHLFVGDYSVNAIDAFRKGRRQKPANHGILSGRAKLTEAQVLEIRRLWATGVSDPKLAKMFGIGPSAAYAITRRVNWKHLP